MGDYINRIKDVAATIRLYYIENQTSSKKKYGSWSQRN
jgi:hypothetical protein